MRGTKRNALRLSRAIARGYWPEDFKLLGEGSTRNAFLGPDGMVYKIVNDLDGVEAQYREIDNYFETIDLMPDGWSLARSKIIILDDFNPVVVMEYVEGVEEDCGEAWCECLDDIGEATGLNDLWHGNYLLTNDGIRVIFDYAM